MSDQALKSYAIKIGGLFLVSLFLFWFVQMMYENGLYGGLIFFVSAWFVMTILVLVTNHFYLVKTKRTGLNLLNWILSLLVLFIGGVHVLTKGWSVNCIPTFSYLASVIAIAMNFIQQK